MSGASHFLNLNGRRFHYIEWGKPAATALVMLHGLRAYARTWERLAIALSGKFRVLALDQRGRGQTDWDPQANYYTDTYVSDLEAFVDALAIDRFVLVGHSMGGTTAYVYTAAHPERIHGTVVEDIGPGSSVKGAGYERIIREIATIPDSFANMDEATAYWRALRPKADASAIEQRVAHTVRVDAHGRVRWRFDWKGIQKTRLRPDPDRIVDLWPVVSSLTRPTLVMRGERSDFLSRSTCEAMAAKNPNIQWAEIPNASHYAHDDNASAYQAQMEGFLTSLDWT